MAGSVRDIDHGYKALLHDLGLVAKGSPRVFVGILQDKGAEYGSRPVVQADGSKVTEKDTITLAGYAAVNEFGSDDGHTPERSYLRSTLDENRVDYGERLDKAVDELIVGVKSGVPGAGFRRMERSLGLLGARVSRDVKRKIRDIREPANAPYTLARKYPGNNPLIHTGRLRQAISFQVDMSGETQATTSAASVKRKAGAR